MGERGLPPSCGSVGIGFTGTKTDSALMVVAANSAMRVINCFSFIIMPSYVRQGKSTIFYEHGQHYYEQIIHQEFIKSPITKYKILYSNELFLQLRIIHLEFIKANEKLFLYSLNDIEDESREMWEHVSAETRGIFKWYLMRQPMPRAMFSVLRRIVISCL